jgi:hypothetical protein
VYTGSFKTATKTPEVGHKKAQKCTKKNQEGTDGSHKAWGSERVFCDFSHLLVAKRLGFDSARAEWPPMHRNQIGGSDIRYFFTDMTGAPKLMSSPVSIRLERR